MDVHQIIEIYIKEYNIIQYNVTMYMQHNVHNKATGFHTERGGGTLGFLPPPQET